jgi:hypothetical protein
MQLGKTEDLLGIGLRRYGNQRWLPTPFFQVSIHCVVAQIGGATHKPTGKGRLAVVTYLLGRSFPVHEMGLL